MISEQLRMSPNEDFGAPEEMIVVEGVVEYLRQMLGVCGPSIPSKEIPFLLAAAKMAVEEIEGLTERHSKLTREHTIKLCDEICKLVRKHTMTVAAVLPNKEN